MSSGLEAISSSRLFTAEDSRLGQCSGVTPEATPDSVASGLGAGEIYLGHS